MLLDNRKGVEERTRQLFAVCKRRRMPIFTFVNKCDRAGENPLKLLSDVEAELGRQLVQVTLKAGKEAKRLDRKIVEVSGSGQVEVTFQLPAAVRDNLVSFAAFVGKDFSSNLQYLQTDSIRVE